MPRSGRFVLIESFTIRDIVVFVLLFMAVMVVLFPAGRLERIILKEDRLNTYLHIKYLEALSEINPSPDILEALARAYASTGRRAKALEVAELLGRFPDARLRSLRIGYEILKHEYFQARSVEKKRELEKKLRRRLLNIAILEKKRNNLEKTYREGSAMGFHRVALFTAQKLARITGDEEWLRKAVDHALILRDYSTALALAQSLKSEDLSAKVLTYRIYSRLNEHRSALRNLKSIMLSNSEVRVLYLSDLFWLAEKAGEDVFPFLVDLIERTKDRTDKKMLIMGGIRYYTGKQMYDRVKELALRYGAEYPQDVAYTKFILKMALATGDPSFAGEIASKIARELGVVDDTES